jgi:hypothetical protein
MWRNIMKVYQYNIESGVYTGELFEENDSIQYDQGVTTLAPPPYKSGQVPVFDLVSKKWELLPVGAVRQLLQINSITARPNPVRLGQ